MPSKYTTRLCGPWKTALVWMNNVNNTVPIVYRFWIISQKKKRLKHHAEGVLNIYLSIHTIITTTFPNGQCYKSTLDSPIVF